MSERIEIEFGSRVRTLREEAGLSSREFALMIGRSKAYIIQLENGHRNVSLDTIERIAAGLGISLTDLFKTSTRMSRSAPSIEAPPRRHDRVVSEILPTPPLDNASSL